jgi:stalled ribosome rescue protein Dom34
MKEQTIAEAAIEVLKEAKEPMTAAKITQVILDKGLYRFNTKDEVGMARRAIVRRCEGYQRKDSVDPKFFERIGNDQFLIKKNN